MKPKPGSRSPGARISGYMMMECLVYIGLLFVVLGGGYAAMYHCIDNALVLRRNADDIAAALDAGERWRADVRAAGQLELLENSSTNQVLRFHGERDEVTYRFSDNTLSRQVGQGPWTRLLTDIKASSMTPELREAITAWRWELELQPRAKGRVKASYVRPLFSFLAVPAASSK